MRSPPEQVDVLLMEGTNLGTDKPTHTEADLEEDFVGLFAETQGRVFVAWSAQNVDRTVTLYRAAKRTGRTLVVDLYTAEVLKLLSEHGRLPQAGWDNLKVVITSRMARMYRLKGRGDFVHEMATGGRGISASALSSVEKRWVVMLRDSLVNDYRKAGVQPVAEDAWSWSMWKGYLKDLRPETSEWLSAAKPVHIHTSGHASPGLLREFAAAMRPRKLVPIHSFTWDDNTEGFPSIHRLRDGELLKL